MVSFNHIFFSLAFYAVSSGTPLSFFAPWTETPCAVTYSTGLLQQLTPSRKTVVARMILSDSLGELCIVARDEVRDWDSLAKGALFTHERFHRFPLPSHAARHAEALANWYAYRSGYLPADPPGSLSHGMANGWHSEDLSLHYPWWRFFALLPDTTVIHWLRYGELDSLQAQNAMLFLARCFSGDPDACPAGSEPPVLQGFPFPERIPSRSIHVLNHSRCPDQLPESAQCLPAWKGNRKAKAIIWNW